jgi:hypothetical protein
VLQQDGTQIVRDTDVTVMLQSDNTGLLHST